jgi:LacI family transcriptional regulator
VIGLHHSEEVFSLIASQQIPVVTLWNFSDESRLTCIGADNFAIGKTIADHVCEKGYSKVATLFPPLAGNDRAISRAEGVHQTLESFDLAPADKDKLETFYSLSSAKQVVIEYLESGNHVDVIVCGNDVLALGAIYAVQSLGLKVPEDIAVTGIGDFKGSKDVEPAITTVRIPAESIGKIGGEALVQAVINPDQIAENICCPADLVARATS